MTVKLPLIIKHAFHDGTFIRLTDFESGYDVHACKLHSRLRFNGPIRQAQMPETIYCRFVRSVMRLLCRYTIWPSTAVRNRKKFVNTNTQFFSKKL